MGLEMNPKWVTCWETRLTGRSRAGGARVREAGETQGWEADPGKWRRSPETGGERGHWGPGGAGNLGRLCRVEGRNALQRYREGCPEADD